ncbi:hypothetical protein EWB00_009068, partial [Schistosoma japonicum]
ILLSFTLTAMIQDDTLTAQNKSHATKTFQAFYFIAFFSFIAALILYLVIIFVKDLRLLKFGFVGALVVGCFCSIISVIMYYDNLSRYYNATIRPDTSSWLLVVISSGTMSANCSNVGMNVSDDNLSDSSAVIVAAIVEDPTLTAERKSHELKSFQGFYFVALIAFITALVLYIITIVKPNLKPVRILFIITLIIGCKLFYSFRYLLITIQNAVCRNYWIM